MKKYILLVLLFIAFFTKSFTQNLVANPSFEELNWCPHYWYDFASLKDCFPIFIGSPNVYNACCNDTTNASVPSNIFGPQYPRTGNGYAGQSFIFFTSDRLNFK